MDHGAAEWRGLSTTKTTTNNTHENSRYTTLYTPTADGDRKSGGSPIGLPSAPAASTA